MARRVHGERSVGLLYGQRALLIGALEPLTYTGTMLLDRSGNRPFERLARTAKMQETVFLGTREEADEVLARVHRLHETIKGELPEAAGRHPTGTPYSAFDPELMLWTLAVIADSGREMYEALVRPLDPDERDGAGRTTCASASSSGCRRARSRQPRRVQGLVRRQARRAGPGRRPRTGARWRRWSRSASRFRAAARGNLAIQNHIIKGTLPPRVREIFGIRWSRAHERGFRAIAAASRRTHDRFPYRMRRGRNDVFFDVVTKAERQRGGTVTPRLGAERLSGPQPPSTRCLSSPGRALTSIARAAASTGPRISIPSMRPGSPSSV